jgi:hypothetical protein
MHSLSLLGTHLLLVHMMEGGRGQPQEGHPHQLLLLLQLWGCQSGLGRLQSNGKQMGGQAATESQPRS